MITNAQSFKNNLKNPITFATLLTQLVMDLNILGEPQTSILIGLDGAFQIFIGLILMQSSSVTTIGGVKDGEFIAKIQLNILSFIIENEMILQLSIFGFYVIMALFFFIQIGFLMENKGCVSIVYKYTIGCQFLLHLTLIKVPFCIVIISPFLLEFSNQSSSYFKTLILPNAAVNAVLFVVCNLLIPKVFLNKLTIFTKSIQDQPEPLQPIIETAKVLALGFTFLIAGSSSSLTFTPPLWIPNIIILVVVSLEIMVKTIKKTSLQLSEIVRHSFDIGHFSIMIVSIFNSGYIFPQSPHFTQLILYSVILTILYNTGFHFFIYYNRYVIWNSILQTKTQSDRAITSSLELAIHKLQDVQVNGSQSKELKDLMQLISFHKKHLCQDGECICHQYKKIIQLNHQIQSGENGQLDEEQVNLISLYRQDNKQEQIEGNIFSFYITEFLITYAKQWIEVHPHNLDLLIQCLQLISMKKGSMKNIQSQCLLINFQSNGLSTLQMIHLRQIEYMVQEKQFKMQKDQLDPRTLIQYHKLEASLKDTLQNLSLYISDFWIFFEKDTFDVYKQTAQYNQVARTILEAQNDLKKLEDFGSNQLSVNYTQSLLNRLIFSDHALADLYLRKIQSIKDIKRLFNKQQQMQVNKVSFMIVNSTGFSFGRIILANSRLHNVLGYEIGELNKSFRIDNLMLKIVQQVHPAIVSRFYKLGNCGKVFRREGLDTFALQKNGFIVPINMKIEIIYTQQYLFTFLVIFNKMNRVMIPEVPLPIKVNECMIIICHENMQIVEISESCYTLLHICQSYLYQREFETLRENFSLYDLGVPAGFLEDFESNKSKMIDSETFVMDRKIMNSLIYKQARHKDELVDATLYLSRKQIHTRENEFVTYIEAYFRIENLELKSKGPKQAQNDDILDTSSEGGDVQQNINQMDQEQYEKDHENSASFSSNSTPTISQSPENIKLFFNSNQVTLTSRTLKVVLQLVLVVFGIMLLISCLNLYLTITRQIKQREESLIVQNSFDRMFYQNKARVLVRSITYIANGYEPNTSFLLNNRVAKYQSLIQQYIKEMQTFHQSLENVLNQELYGFIRNTTPVQVWFLSDTGGIYDQNQTFSPAFNYYMQENFLFSQFTMDQLKGNLPQQTLINSSYLKPSPSQEIIYYLVQNQYKDIKKRCQSEAAYFLSQSKINSQAGKSQSLITAIISVASIVIVGATLTPILIRFYKKRFNCMSFFIGITKEQINLSKQGCEQFMLQIDLNAKIKVKNERFQKNEKKHKQKRRFLTRNKTKSSNQIQEEGSLTYIDEYEDSEEEKGNNDQFASMYQSMNKSMNQSMQKMVREDTLRKKSTFMNQQSERQLIENNDSNFQKEIVDVEKNKVEQELFEASNQQKTLAIKQANKKATTYTILVLILLIGVLSLYFLATFILTSQVYNEIPRMLDDLETLYNKGIGIEAMIALCRGNLLSNTTIMLTADETGTGQAAVGSTFYVNANIDLQQQFGDMKKDLPSYFSGIASFITSMESDLCGTLSSLNATIDNCNGIYNGILKLGYSNILALIIEQYQKQDFLFYTNTARSYSFLYNQLTDQYTLDLLEINEIILSVVGEELKNRATNSTIDYLLRIRSAYGILFAVFSVLLLVLLVVFITVIYQRMKAQAVLTNVGLKILPLENKNKEQLGRIKEFCIN